MSTLPNMQATWGTLSLQLTPANPIIALSRMMVASWNPSEVASILRAYYDHTGHVGMLVQDMAMANRIFLRPITNDVLRTMVPVPQNLAQSSTVPPHVTLQRPVNLPQETLLHIAHGRNVPRRAIAQTLIKRPLNSWMAYRSYYSTIFIDLLQVQKNTSTHLKHMWNHDPFKAKWAVIARAYSSIRNLLHGTPLRTFLALVCPEMGIIGAREYLDKLGWTVNVTGDSSLSLQYTPLLPQASHSLTVMHATSMTDQDIIHFCSQRGLISPQNAALATQGRRGIAKTKRAKRAKMAKRAKPGIVRKRRHFSRNNAVRVVLRVPRQSLSFQVASTYASQASHSLDSCHFARTIRGSRFITVPLSDSAKFKLAVENLISNPDGSDAPQNFGEVFLGEESFRAQLTDYIVLSIPEHPSRGNEPLWNPNGAMEYLKSYEWLTGKPMTDDLLRYVESVVDKYAFGANPMTTALLRYMEGVLDKNQSGGKL